VRIGIDISQIAYGQTGVSNYLENLVRNLISVDKNNEYVLFFSSLRRNFQFGSPSGVFNFKSNPNVSIKQFKLPPSLLDLLWNKLHVFPIENFIGPVDWFITSDWTEPPVKSAKKATIIYDLIVYKYPEETHSKTEFNLLRLLISPNIVKTQKRKHAWVKKESDVVFTISESSKKDIVEILGIDPSKIKIIYPSI